MEQELSGIIKCLWALVTTQAMYFVALVFLIMLRTKP